MDEKEVDFLAWNIRLGLDKQALTDREQLEVAKRLVEEIEKDLEV